MEHCQADLFTELIGSGKVLQQGLGENGDFVREERRVESRSFRQRNTLVDAVQSVSARIESFGTQESRGRPLFDNELYIAQLIAKSARQSIDDSADFFSELSVVQGP